MVSGEKRSSLTICLYVYARLVAYVLDVSVASVLVEIILSSTGRTHTYLKSLVTSQLLSISASLNCC